MREEMISHALVEEKSKVARNRCLNSAQVAST